MTFISRVIGPDEKKVGVMTAHWIYGVRGLDWLISFLLIGWAINHFVISFLAGILGESAYNGLFMLSNYVYLVCIGIGALAFLFYCVKMLTTELGLTDRRVILKTGLLMVDVKEIDIEEIKAANVDNGWLGRIFNYGYIFLDSRFVQNIQLPAVGDPYRFVKALNEARSILAEDAMHLVLDENGAAAKSQIDHAVHGQQQPAHHMEDDRYQSGEAKPSQSMRHVKRDLEESAYAKAEQLTPAADQRRGRQRKSGLKPLLFRKEIMRESFKDDFSDTLK